MTTFIFRIILICIFFNMLHASENNITAVGYVRDYTNGHYQVLDPQSRTNHASNNDIVPEILQELGCNNKLFVCYPGYKIVEWEESVGYRTSPHIKEKKNFFTEIDLETKIEKDFSKPKEINHNFPIKDIARWKDNYYIAQTNNIYICHAAYSYFGTNKLLLHQHLELPDDDNVQKIFIEPSGNVIAISNYGNIFRQTINSDINFQPSQKKIHLTILCNVIAKNNFFHTFAYNAKENLLLLASKNILYIIALDILLSHEIPLIFKIKTSALRINTIDTSDTHILLSNAIPNPDTAVIHNNQGHCKKSNDCCKERMSNPNNHPYLPDSCRQTTIVLMKLKNLMDVLKKNINNKENNAHCTLSLLNPIIFNHTRYEPSGYYYLGKAVPVDESKRIITHSFINNDFLFVGINNYTDFSRGNDIYQFPLATLNQMSFDSILRKDKSDKINFLHHGYDANYPGEKKYRPIGFYCPLKVIRNSEIKNTIVLTRIGSSCSAQHGSCIDYQNERDHFFQWVCDTIIYHKKNDLYSVATNNWISSILKNQIIAIKRWMHSFRVKALLPSGKTFLICAFIGFLVVIYMNSSTLE